MPNRPEERKRAKTYYFLWRRHKAEATEDKIGKTASRKTKEAEQRKELRSLHQLFLSQQVSRIPCSVSSCVKKCVLGTYRRSLLT